MKNKELGAFHLKAHLRNSAVMDDLDQKMHQR